MRPRLAILSLDFWPQSGGVQTYLHQLARYLSRDRELFVVTPVVDPGQPTTYKRITLSSPSVRAYANQLRSIKPDVVLIGHSHPKLMLAALLSQSPKTIVLAYGNDFLAAQNRWHRPLFNRMMAVANTVVAISEASALALRQLGLSNVRVILPGTDPDIFYPAGRSDSARPTLLTVSRLVPRKGIDDVIVSLASLAAEHPGLSYQVAGTGPDLPRLQALAEQNSVERFVSFLGFVPDEKLPALYRQSDIFIMVSREEQSGRSVEGFGIVYLEASASGLPIVAARSGGVTEAVLDNRTGLLIDPGDRKKLALTLRRLLEDADLRRRLGAAGRHWVETEMNWNRTATQMSELIAGL